METFAEIRYENLTRWIGMWLARQPIRELIRELDKLTVATTVSAARFKRMTLIIEPLAQQLDTCRADVVTGEKER